MIINLAAYDTSALPGNPIRKGRTTSSANPNHLLNNLLFSHLAAPGHNIINYLHHIPDDRQCVGHLSGMLLLYDLLHVRRLGGDPSLGGRIRG